MVLSRRRRSFPRRVVERHYGGFALRIQLIDQKGERWYDRDLPLDPEIDLLNRHRLRRGARVFDIGAHQGVVALVLAQIVGPSGQVVAIEASPFDAAGAQENKELNSCSQLLVRNAAIAAENGSIKFSVSGRVSSSHSRSCSIDVPACTIDALADEFGIPDVLFIDVDGFEVDALRGATRVLSHLPDIYMEVHPPYLEEYGYSAEDAMQYLRASDYQLFASSSMNPTLRGFTEWKADTIDMTKCFHVVAISRS